MSSCQAPANGKFRAEWHGFGTQSLNPVIIRLEPPSSAKGCVVSQRLVEKGLISISILTTSKIVFAVNRAIGSSDSSGHLASVGVSAGRRLPYKSSQTASRCRISFVSTNRPPDRLQPFAPDWLRAEGDASRSRATPVAFVTDAMLAAGRASMRLFRLRRFGRTTTGSVKMTVYLCCAYCRCRLR